MHCCFTSCAPYCQSARRQSRHLCNRHRPRLACVRFLFHTLTITKIIDHRQVQLRGRAALSNPAVRFDSVRSEHVDDGWDRVEELPVLRTTVSIEVPRRVISKNTSPDLSFDSSINPYRGCEHGCIYCFARPSHAYLSLSPGLDFETKLIARPDAPAILEKELRNPRYRPAMIAIGTNTDPYQPIEKKHEIMRGILKVLAKFNHPLALLPKA